MRLLNRTLFSHRTAPTSHRCKVKLVLEELAERITPSTTNVWVHGGTTTNWSEAANWSLGHVPHAGEIIEFGAGTGFSNTDAQDDVSSITVDGIQCDSGYTGTITVNGVTLNVTGDFVQYGILTGGGAATISVGNDFLIFGELDSFDLTINGGAMIVETPGFWYTIGTPVNATVQVYGTQILPYNMNMGAEVTTITGSYYLGPFGSLEILHANEFDYSGTTSMLLDGTAVLSEGLLTSNAGITVGGTLYGGDSFDLDTWDIVADLHVYGGTFRIDMQGTVDGNLDVADGTVQFDFWRLELGVSGTYSQDSASTLNIYFRDFLHVTDGSIGGTVNIDAHGRNFNAPGEEDLLILGDSSLGVSLVALNITDYTTSAPVAGVTAGFLTSPPASPNSWGIIVF
jgi:hypothetical protein